MKANKGFSLVELVCVIGIVGMLTSMGNQIQRNIRVRSEQLVGKVQLRELTTRAKAYEAEKGFYAAGPAAPIVNNFQTKTSCNIPTHPLRFTIKDCRKQKYSLFMAVTGTSSENTRVSRFTAVEYVSKLHGRRLAPWMDSPQELSGDNCNVTGSFYQCCPSNQVYAVDSMTISLLTDEFTHTYDILAQGNSAPSTGQCQDQEQDDDD